MKNIIKIIIILLLASTVNRNDGVREHEEMTAAGR